MKRFRKLPQTVVAIAVAGALGVATAGTAVASGDSMSSKSTGSKSSKSATARPTLVEIAASNPQFSTLVTAVTAAGLADTLSGKGPFTVFAPTNDAFAKIPADQLQAILADKETLTKILTYHVIGDRVLSKDLKRKQSVGTVEGSPVEILLSKKRGASIEGAKIVQTDIRGRNGVIHVIDTVILPASLR